VTANVRLPVVSVICPCLNSTPTLALQLDALAAQRCEVPWEMIVVDDGSTDGTPALARSYQGRFPALQVLETPSPRSQAEGINAGAAAARGRHLLVVDSDDEVTPGYLAAMTAALDLHPVVGARLDDEALNPAFTRVRHQPMQQTGLTVLDGYRPVIVGAALGIRRDVFEAIGGFDPASTPLIDVDLSWRLQRAGVPLAFVPDAVLRYRYRTGWLATYRQKRSYGQGEIFLHRRFRSAGAPHRGWRTVGRSWWNVVRSAVRVRDRRSALLLADHLGGAVGRTRGWCDRREADLGPIVPVGPVASGGRLDVVGEAEGTAVAEVE
jgi:glycosyltransferase involved in cell wall biosynthesis